MLPVKVRRLSRSQCPVLSLDAFFARPFSHCVHDELAACGFSKNANLTNAASDGYALLAGPALLMVLCCKRDLCCGGCLQVGLVQLGIHPCLQQACDLYSLVQKSPHVVCTCTHVVSGDIVEPDMCEIWPASAVSQLDCIIIAGQLQ